MSARRKVDREKRQSDDATELLRDLLIVELSKAGVPQSQIRKLAGCGMNRVSAIARFFKGGDKGKGPPE